MSVLGRRGYTRVMPDTPTPELCAPFARRILERHDQARPEAEIGAAVRDFLIGTGLAPEVEIEMEQSPASDESGRVDLRTRDVIVEFKRRIGDRINPSAEHVAQLDAYLRAAVAGGQPQRLGILSDGKYWVLRWPGMGAVSTQPPNAFTLSDGDQGGGLLLYEWLRDHSQALEARGVHPADDEVRSRLGDGPRFAQQIAALDTLYQEHRDEPTVALKRDLWRSLLAAALGQVVADAPDLDRLFVRHTYLSAVVGLALQSAFGIDLEAAAHDDPAALLGGQLFVDRTGVSGVVESDFFSWPAEVGDGDWIRGLARRAARFNWEQSQSDIARILYEAVIPAEDRRRLGEYYTPDWLARMIVDEVVTDPLNQRVLDPACGSGTFIHVAATKYLAAARDAGLGPSATLEGLINQVIGIDVHPVAVHLARATWTFAARDAIHAAADVGGRVRVTVPVYLGDSLQLRTESSGMFAQRTVTIPVPDGPEDILERNRELQFPRALVEQADWFDNLMTRMADYIERGGDALWALDEERIGDGPDREILEHTATLLSELHQEGLDHIWAYYTRNLVRPLALRREPVDVVVGNPPWITYHQTQAQVRTSLEKMSKDTYDIWTGGLYAKHQDMSSLFFTRCVNLYLRQGGEIGMVLPHSALQAGQFSKWRTGSWADAECDLGARLPWDLERIEPNTFFPLPSCVVFGQRVSADQRARALPRQALRLIGGEGGPFRRHTVPLYDTVSKHMSPYAKRARTGASLFPRALLFVKTSESDMLVRATETVMVSPRRSPQEKSPWKELPLTELMAQPIESRHIYRIHLGETVTPYMLLKPLSAALPLSTTTGRLAKQNSGWYGLDALTLKPRMRWRWRLVNKIHSQHAQEHSNRTLLEQIDYFSQLTVQRQQLSDIRVVYASSGRPTAAIVTDPDAIIDYTLFWISCATEAEASYLTAIINSKALETAVQPLMPKGQFGARHVVKHLWRLPIAEFDASDALHVEIAEAGQAAASGAQRIWSELSAERQAQGKSVSVTVARREIRQWLEESEEGRRVEGLVGQLLG